MNRFRGLWRFSTVAFHKGTPEYVKGTEQVQLRGVTLKGRYNDLPTMLFFPEMCDPIENWIPFFTHEDNKILNYRNVHILSARNFGNSDRFNSFDIEDMANDVVRYMYQHKITMATMAGHGFGAKLALATGCYHHDRVTGVFCVDYTPMDLRYHEAFQEFQKYIITLRNINVCQYAKGQVEMMVKHKIDCPKWRSLFCQQLRRTADGQCSWRFEFNYLYENVKFNKADSVAYWPTKAGLFPGRAHFIFPEYSRWVHLGTNTLPMMKKCPQLKGFGHDIHSIQGDENPLNHWIYEFPNQSYVVASKLTKFLQLYDGVHVLLKDRTEIGNVYIPDIIYSKKDANHIYSDYTPSHLYHNWRFRNVYGNTEQQQQ